MVRFVQLYHPLPDHARWRHAEQYSRDLLQTTEEVDESSSTTPHHVFICRRTHPSHCLGIFHGENPLNCSFNIILFDLVLMILITTVLRLLLKPLKQPRIVSEIIVSNFCLRILIWKNSHGHVYRYLVQVACSQKLVGPN
jgi:hypothetical protein